MTVTEVVANFRAGLMSLLPSVERLGITWKRPDAYDEWDNLAAAVYQALVVEPLRASIPEVEQERFNPPDYDLLLPSYAGKFVIEVLPPSADGIVRVFHALGTLATPFDIVEWRAVGPTGVPSVEKLETSPWGGATFALRRV